MTTGAAIPDQSALSSDECWQLLQSSSVGRLAVCANDRPDIYPVNYKVHQNRLVFRTGPGSKLASALGRTVAFEADGTEKDGRVAWSVVVRGYANRLNRTPAMLNSVGRLLVPWDSGTKDHFIGISVDDITGRRFAIAASLTWGGQLDDATRLGME